MYGSIAKNIQIRYRTARENILEGTTPHVPQVEGSKLQQYYSEDEELVQVLNKSVYCLEYHASMYVSVGCHKHLL